MTSLRRIIVAGLVAVLGGGSAVALTACSDDDVLGGDDEQIEISLTERDLKPGRVEADAGKIEFEVRNDGDRLHAFAIETPGGIERTKNIKPGESENLTVDLSDGRYRMYDPRGGYRMRGVRGTVVVKSGRTETETVRERTVERTVVEPAPAPEADDPELQDPEVQEPPPPPPPPPPVTVTAPPPAQTTP